MLTVADVMTKNPVSTSPDATLQDAIRAMKQHRCRQLPVLVGDRLAGIITDRDIRLAMNSPFVLHDKSDDHALLQNTSVADCMTPNPLTIDPDMPASAAADLMKTYKFGGLPVVHESHMVGIVTTSDILTSYIELLSPMETH